MHRFDRMKTFIPKQSSNSRTLSCSSFFSVYNSSSYESENSYQFSLPAEELLEYG